MKGFTFPYKGKTVFVKTERDRKTRSLARNILKEMSPRKYANEEGIEVVLKWLDKAECEVKQLDNGTDWYSLKGKNFTEFGPLNELEIIHII